MQERTPNCSLRVLVVGTHLMRRVSLTNNLRQKFKDVVVVDGDKGTLLDRAQTQIEAQRCHVAVVVHDTDSPDDLSANLDVLQKRLAPAGVVICAVRPDDLVAFRAGRLRMEYVRYDAPINELWAAVEAVGRQDCHCGLTVHWPHQNFAEYVATRLRWARESVTDEHLLDLMGRVFPGARNVQMQLLPELQTTSLIASAIGRAVVLYASEQYPGNAARRIPKVLKIGPADEIAREIDRYERFVNGWLHQYRQARLENHARVWHLGAITYAFLGVTPHDMAPFRAFYLYPRSQSDVILGMLRQLFIETCHNWYAQEREQVPEMVLFDEYDNALELQERIEERLDTQTPTLTFEGIDAPLPNPAIWALETGRQIIFPTITTCITHGDLHGDNLFVDRNMQAWLVDFGRSGFGHALRDFVELEADIKLRLISRGGADLASLAALERSLLASSAPGEMLLPSAAVAANPALHKAFQVVAGLRHLAFLTTCIDNPLEYYHALLYETLYMATLRRLQNPVRERAWCSAALIVERLQKPAGAPGTSAALTDLTGASLAQQPSEQAIPALTARLRYLAFCETSVKLQAAMYNGGEGGVPATLQAGVSALGQAVTHTRHLLDSLRGNGGTAG